MSIRWFGILPLGILLALLTACAVRSAEGERETSASFSIAVRNETQADLHGLHCEYAVDGELIGGMEATVSGGGGTLPLGETITFSFTPGSAAWEDFSFELSGILADGREIPIGGKFSVDARVEDCYPFVLSGSLSEGLFCEKEAS